VPKFSTSYFYSTTKYESMIAKVMSSKDVRYMSRLFMLPSIGLFGLFKVRNHGSQPHINTPEGRHPTRHLRTNLVRVNLTRVSIMVWRLLEFNRDFMELSSMQCGAIGSKVV
jgi:hypothetical protein